MGGCCNSYKEANEMLTRAISNKEDDENVNENKVKKLQKLKTKEIKIILDPEDDVGDFINIVDIIFYLFNEMRNNPGNYLESSKDYDLYDYFKKLKKSSSIPFSKENITEIKDYLYEPKIFKKPTIEKEDDVLNIVNNGNFTKAHIFQSISASNDIKDNVWKLLQNYKEDIKFLLNEDHEYISIICQSLANKTKILVTYIIFDK